MTHPLQPMFDQYFGPIARMVYKFSGFHVEICAEKRGVNHYRVKLGHPTVSSLDDFRKFDSIDSLEQPFINIDQVYFPLYQRHQNNYVIFIVNNDSISALLFNMTASPCAVSSKTMLSVESKCITLDPKIAKFITALRSQAPLTHCRYELLAEAILQIVMKKDIGCQFTFEMLYRYYSKERRHLHNYHIFQKVDKATPLVPHDLSEHYGIKTFQLLKQLDDSEMPGHTTEYAFESPIFSTVYYRRCCHERGEYFLSKDNSVYTYFKNAVTAQYAPAMIMCFYDEGERNSISSGVANYQGLSPIVNSYQTLSADMGCAESQIYTFFKLINDRYPNAQDFLMLAAKQKYADAYYSLYDHGEQLYYLRSHPHLAKIMLHLAAEYGDPRACEQIAQCYQDGAEGYPQDRSKAIHYYRMAIDNGSEAIPILLLIQGLLAL